MKKVKSQKSKITIFIFFSCLLFLLITPVNAQNAAQQGISVTPSIEHIDLAVDAPEYTLTYTNNTKSDITLLLSVKDFSAFENSYRIDFLSPQDAANYKYSLSSWISFENNTLEIGPGEKQSVKVFINKNRITKGGHYASILAKIQQPENKNQVNVIAVISSLLFVRANTGQEIEDGKIQSLDPLRNGIEYPNVYVLEFENRGNVHVIPYGLIQIYDPLGNLVAKGILNINSLDALPESIRRYDISVKTYQNILLPGFYTAKLSMHFGKTDKKLQTSVKFFSQGSFDFGKIALGLFILIGVIVFVKRKKPGLKKS